MTDQSPDNSAFGPEQSSPYLTGERVSFTGTLASMTHRQALELVEQHGGTANSNVSRQTTMLVVGEEGWPLEENGQPSQKLQQIVEWQQEGVEIKLLNESEWLHLLGLEERRREVHRLYTPAMLSRLFDLPASTIRRWERVGLIRAVQKVYRLPYFDFQQVASARKIVELLEAGISPNEIEKSITGLNKLLGRLDQPLASLDVLGEGSRLLYRDETGLLQPRTGQRFFDFEPPQSSPESESAPATTPIRGEPTDERVNWSADDWFQEGCRLLDDGEPETAAEAFRLSLMEVPGDAETNFHLAEALYRSGNRDGALERYHAAVETDHEYLEAWTQLGCIHEEKEQFEAALDAFRIALEVHPDYPDAHLHLAEVLQRLDRTDEAVLHWRTYLQFDSRGPWAEQARQRLEEVAHAAD